MQAGGNAVDAAVALALSLAYFYPQAGSLGGGGFALLRYEGRYYSLDFRETAPQGVRLQEYLSSSGVPLSGATLWGGKAVATPGMPFGYRELHRRFGNVPWDELVRRVYEIGEKEGFVSHRLSRDLQRFSFSLTREEETRQFFFPSGVPLPPGAPLPFSGLTHLLQVYAQKGDELFRSGELSSKVATIVQEKGGYLSVEDFRSYKALWREPRRFNAWGYEFYCMDLPSGGGMILETAIQLLTELGIGPGTVRSPEYTLRLIEVLRRVYLLRQNLGDPDELSIPIPDLRSRALLEKIKETLSDYGIPINQVRQVLEKEGILYGSESTETTHLSVVDRWGNLVSMTITLNTPFGSGIWIPSLGIFLNNEIDDFALTITFPNLYGLIQGPNNLLRAGRRPLSSMTPCVIVGKDREFAIGSPGGSRIPSAILQVVLEMLLFSRSPRDAILKPRLHHQAFPDILFFEPGALSKKELSHLYRKGFKGIELFPIGEVYLAGRYRTKRGWKFFAEADSTRGLGATGRVIP